MKTFHKIVSSFFLILVSLLAFVLAFIELRALFAGDFLLMNSLGAAFIAYLCRGLFFVILGSYNICVLLTIIKRNGASPTHFLIAPFMLLASLFSLFFYTQWIYWLVVFIALVPCAAIFSRRPIIK